MSDPDLITTTIQLPEDLRDRLKNIAAESHRSLAGQVRYFLEDAVLRHNTAHQADQQTQPATR